MTKKEIKKAAKAYAGNTTHDNYTSFIDGAEWVYEEMKASMAANNSHNIELSKRLGKEMKAHNKTFLKAVKIIQSCK